FNNTLSKIVAKHSEGEKIDYINTTVEKKKLEKLITDSFIRFGSAVTAEIADEVKRLGFKYATIAGISISIEDLKVPASKKQIVDRATHQVDQLDKQFKAGTLSAKERFIRSIDIWGSITEEITQQMLKGFDKLNSVYVMAFSGARGSLQQVRQLAGIRGLMADPSGNIINIPIKTNFKEGLSVTEYSSYGARKGLVDTALRTADSGYLTRRLVDVAQDVIITEEDCKSKEGITLSNIREGYEEIIPLSVRLIGRTLTKNVADPITGKVIAKAGEEVTEEQAKDISAAGIEKVQVRSVLSCASKRGLCQTCYGKDLSHRGIVNIGEAVGIIAAQSIGEPGTQLTMRTFHIGGVALHKGAVVKIKVRHGGKIEFGEGIELQEIKDDSGNKVTMVTRLSSIFVKIKDKREEYVLPLGAIIKVKEKDHIESGDVVAEYDATYEYLTSSAAGKTLFLGLDILERRKKLEGKTLMERIAKNDAEMFVYDPKVKKSYSVPKGAKVFVKVGKKVNADEDLAQGVTAKSPGIVISISGKLKKEVVVAPGENYSILAGSRVNVNNGEMISAYTLLATVESIRRDPSKTRDIIQGLPRVEELFEARRPKEPALLSDSDGVVAISESEGARLINIKGSQEKKEYTVPYETRLHVTSGDKVSKGTQLTDGTISPHDILRIFDVNAAQTLLVDEIQKIYKGQGVTINDKHIEVIVRQMTKKVRVVDPGETVLLPGELIDSNELERLNKTMKGDKANAMQVLLGITKASLSTDSFISAASFQETARILTDAAIKGKVDDMYGLKENVIIGKLIPAGTGFDTHRNIDLTPNVTGGGSAK
ncbi:DNA-directed RNA polymerase subunit beta'', partial [Candidatus Margulisiibacteriota bacterium]